jgi:hypothetical protein
VGWVYEQRGGSLCFFVCVFMQFKVKKVLKQIKSPFLIIAAQSSYAIIIMIKG